MRHCCKFNADDIYYLEETDLYTNRKLSIGFCPICNKPVAELVQTSFTGAVQKHKASGTKADQLLNKIGNQIKYSMKECNYLKHKSKPFGWKYGINKLTSNKNKEIIKQYACDFYGNKELIKIS